MMLALVKCLFWTIRGLTEPELVLAHLSFFSFHLSVLLAFPQLYHTGDTAIFFFLLATLKGNNNVKQIIWKMYWDLSLKMSFWATSSCFDELRGHFFALEVTFNCADLCLILTSSDLMNEYQIHNFPKSLLWMIKVWLMIPNLSFKPFGNVASLFLTHTRLQCELSL